jgi:hypothetical protein
MGAMHAAGNVRYPIGLLRSLIERAKVGQFVPNRSVAGQPSTGSLAIAATRSDEPPKRSSAPGQSLSPIGHQTLSRIRERLESGGA